MKVNWIAYEPYDLGEIGARSQLPRAEARRVFEQCMNAKAERVGMLGRLLEANGVQLSAADASVQDLNDWFFDNVEAAPEAPGRLLLPWYSVVNDIALFLGDVMIQRHPTLRWEFFTWGKSNVAFQRHVIMGFSTEDERFHTNIDVETRVAAYAHAIVQSRGSTPTYGTVEVRGTRIDVDAAVAAGGPPKVDRDEFLRWLRNAADRA